MIALEDEGGDTTEVIVSWAVRGDMKGIKEVFVCFVGVAEGPWCC